jgi:two-component sensor histidine kinase
LIVHELASNSIKCGALSEAAGALEFSCFDEDGEVVVVWKETGGGRYPLPPSGQALGAG